jgi:hypothetical protein
MSDDVEARKEKFKKERSPVWLTKAEAAKRADVSRVTLDGWISGGVLPAAAVLNEGPRKTKIDAFELDRVAADRKSNKPGEAAKQEAAEADALKAKNRELEIQLQSSASEIQTLKSSLTLLEDQSGKRIDDKDAAFGRERELSAKVEADLRDQLAKAEARADAAEKEAKKGVFGKLFS